MASEQNRHITVADTTAAVDKFLKELDHPFKKEIYAIRKSILGVDPAIADGIKWNAPSYRTSDYFATTNLREKKGIGIILHFGAKARKLPDISIDDPNKLLKWLAKDRAMIVFQGMADFRQKQPAFEDIVRQWIRSV